MVLAGMIGLHAMPWIAGETILLNVEPVDPRDFFRGNYAILGCKYSRVPPEGIAGLEGSNRWQLQGRTVYAWLAPEADGQHWRMERLSINPPPTGKCLCGTVTGYGQVSCGIEAYYVQEGHGRQYETAIRNRHLSAQGAVTSGGRAALRGFRVEWLDFTRATIDKYGVVPTNTATRVQSPRGISDVGGSLNGIGIAPTPWMLQRKATP